VAGHVAAPHTGVVARDEVDHVAAPHIGVARDEVDLDRVLDRVPRHEVDEEDLDTDLRTGGADAGLEQVHRPSAAGGTLP